MDLDIKAVLKEIWAKVQAGEWDLQLLALCLRVAYWLSTLADETAVFRGVADADREQAEADVLAVCTEIYLETTGDGLLVETATTGGPVIDSLIAVAIRVVISKLLQKLADSGLPQEAIDWLTDKLGEWI